MKSSSKGTQGSSGSSVKTTGNGISPSRPRKGLNSDGKEPEKYSNASYVIL